MRINIILCLSLIHIQMCIRDRQKDCGKILEFTYSQKLPISCLSCLSLIHICFYFTIHYLLINMFVYCEVQGEHKVFSTLNKFIKQKNMQVMNMIFFTYYRKTEQIFVCVLINLYECPFVSWRMKKNWGFFFVILQNTLGLSLIHIQMCIRDRVKTF